MIFDGGAGLSDDFVHYPQLCDFDPEGPISIHPMSHYEKQSQYDMLGMDFPAAGNGMSDQDAYQFLQPSYESHLTNQDALTAVPQDSGVEFVHGGGYAPRYEYSGSNLASMDAGARQLVPSSAYEQPEALRTVVNESQPSIRKRKASVDSDYAESNPSKRSAVAYVQLQGPNGDCYDLSGQTSPYSSFVPTPAAGSVYQPSYGPNGSPRGLGHHYSTSNASQVSLAAPSPHTPAFSPSFTTVKTEQSPRAPMTPVPQPGSAAPSPFDSNPKLVRTSTIPQQPSPGMSAAMVPGVQTQTFNPYAMYPHNKASLRLIGNLDDVATNWSDEELEARRKLVVFTRTQNGSVIDTEFKVVPQQDWQRQDITVNCIWWKERKEAYVTSVDTIALLEQLVGVRFTVEEKNRIRRNLEGFRPQTVSKAKADSEEFFKVIMGFPTPKPRNIEKDVKVFPWRILSGALKKIISKYSASYSSTASTLGGPTAPVFAPFEAPAEYHYPPSPGHQMRSHMPHAPFAGGYENGMMPGRLSAPVTTVSDLPLQMPTMAPNYGMMHNTGFEPVHFPPGPVYYGPQAMDTPVGRVQGPWNFGNFPQ